MTVLQNICFGLQRLTKTESLTRARQKIAVTRLEGLEDRYPHQLSGGQQQRVALARALVMEPEALLLDEPFSALDNYLRDQMEKELLEILGEYRGATLFVTHNLEEAYQVCHDLLILDHGGKIAFGSKDNIFRKPPTYSAAQITGCQNLSRARMVSGDTVKAIDWGCRLKVTQQIPADLTHVGIRAHHLVFAQNTGGNNVFPCRVSRTKESPHHMSLYLNLDSPLAEHNNYLLQIEVLKEKWEVLKQSPFPWYIRFEPSFLFLTGR